MTIAELDRLERLVAGMTPGEWHIDPASDLETTAIENDAGDHVCIFQHDIDEETQEVIDADFERCGDNAEGIVALRNHAAELIAIARAALADNPQAR